MSVGPELTGAKQEGTRFRPGQSGNPKGRPKGARSRLSEDFLEALAADFAAHGRAVIAQVRDEDPATYLKIIASLMPRHFHMTPADPFADFEDGDLADMLAFVQGEIRAAQARPSLNELSAGTGAPVSAD